jgi:peptide/nickel transport system permease protein
MDVALIVSMAVSRRGVALAPETVDSHPGVHRRRARLNGALVIGATLCGVLLVFAAVGPAVVGTDAQRQDLSNRLAEPVFSGGGLRHPFGTDQLGRDIWVRMAVGVRYSMFIACVVTAIALVTGVVLGIVAVMNRAVDRLVRFLVDVQMAIPAVILAIVTAALFSPGLWVVVAVLAFSGWVSYQRVVRAQTRTLLAASFVEASRSMGGGRFWIARKHLLPNAAIPVIVIATQQIAAVVLFEAALSYLGLGVPAETTTLGGMVAGGREAMLLAWWVPTLPGLAIAIAVLALNFLGDGLRTHFDPRSS